MAAGQPRKYNPAEIDELKIKFSEYIDQNKIPILAEFASINNINRQIIYDYPEFSTLKKRCLNKKEGALEKLALANKINVAMAIFSLKQLGWSDKHDISARAEILYEIKKPEIEEDAED